MARATPFRLAALGAPRSARAAAVAAIAALLLIVAAAASPGDQPSIDSPDLKLDVSTRLFEPWGNSSSAVEGSSYAIGVWFGWNRCSAPAARSAAVARSQHTPASSPPPPKNPNPQPPPQGASVAHVALGPCVYRAFHWHSTAWEIFTLTHGQGPVRSLMIAPGAGESRVREDTLRHGESIAYPAGWVHLQLNDGCHNATALLVWNAVHSGGVNNVAQQLGAIRDVGGYSAAVFPRGRGPRQGYWLRDAECARRCGLDDGAGVGALEEGSVAAEAAGLERALDPALA